MKESIFSIFFIQDALALLLVLPGIILLLKANVSHSLAPKNTYDIKEIHFPPGIRVHNPPKL